MIVESTLFLNVDLAVKSIAEPSPFIQALGRAVLCQRIGKAGRAHWIRIMLSRQPKSPEDAIRSYAALVSRMSGKARTIWDKAISKELDIGIQAGFEPTSAEWVLERRVVDAMARLGARVRITVYAAEPPKPKRRGDTRRKKPTS
jgi:hypothetical protein